MWDGVRDQLQRATLGHYVIEAELGRGGMAAVYLAHEIMLERRVAIKVMSPMLLMGDGMIGRFRQEAMTVAKLSHPHIVSIYAVRQEEDLQYFVMAYIEGQSIDRVGASAGALSIDVVRAIICQVAGALHYAHRRGVIHRDVKPANIMLDQEGNAIVTDFGIARVTSGPRLTMTGGTLGTPAYMSPEQCNATEITGASDQYSLGVVAYELLTGVPPFSGSSFALMLAHTRDAPIAVQALRPDCPPELAAIVARMMEKDPAARWPSLGTVASAIGMPPIGDDDPVRIELEALASAGVHGQPRVSVPVSPPVQSRGVASAGPAMRVETPAEPQPPAPQPPAPQPPAAQLPPAAAVPATAPPPTAPPAAAPPEDAYLFPPEPLPAESPPEKDYVFAPFVPVPISESDVPTPMPNTYEEPLLTPTTEEMLRRRWIMIGGSAVAVIVLLALVVLLWP